MTPSGLFQVTGSPYLGAYELTGEPLAPADLFAMLELTRPGLGAVQAAVAANDFVGAADALRVYLRARRFPPWPTWPANEPGVPPARVAPLPAKAGDTEVADAALRHVFQPYTGYPPADYGPQINWDWDPHQNIEWPSGMHRFYTWDLPMARCYCATGDARYAESWIGLTRDWMVQNPLTRERLPFPKSWDAIQVGIRCARWTGLLPYFLDAAACTSEFLVLLLTALYNHARRILLMPYPFPDNFLVIESSGLASVALVFPEFAAAAQWRETALSRLAAAYQRQYQPDGFQGELAPGYHLYCTNLYLEVLELAAATEVAVPFAAEVERSCDALVAITAPDRQTFCVGDSARHDARPTLARAARLFHRPDFAWLATDGSTGTPPARCCRQLPHSGFYSFRSGWDREATWLGLHCGPASLADAFHCQFDNGTFELMAQGRLLMRDPGVYSYRSGAPEREEFRRTAVHQTLTLTGANATRAGHLVAWQAVEGPEPAALTVANAGYPGLTHRRTVWFVRQRWFVLLDEAIGEAPGTLDLHFQFSETAELTVEPARRLAYTLFPEGANVLVAAADGPVALTREDGWFSARHFVRQPLPGVCFRHQQPAPARFLTALVPYLGPVPPEVTVGWVGPDVLFLAVAGERCEFRSPAPQ